MRPQTERNRRRDQTARLPGRWRKLRYETRARARFDWRELEALAPHSEVSPYPDRVTRGDSPGMLEHAPERERGVGAAGV